MKITSVEVFLLQRELSSTMRISRGGFTRRQHALVRLQTDAGISGLGEGIGNARYIKALIESAMGAMVLGKDPMQIEGLRRTLLDSQVYFERKGSAICAASALEMALWDIKGKALRCPVYELLGGRCASALELYASDVYWTEDPAEMAHRAASIAERGIRTVKAHVGAAGPREDARRVAACRDVLGSEVGLMIDLNCGYTYEQALEALDRWEQYQLRWLEEPLNPNHIDRMSQLRARARIPIAAGENEFTIFGFRELLERGAIDVAMPDIGRAGGISETRNICALAEAFGVSVSPHNFSSGVLLAATAHLMAATPGTSLLEFDASENAVYEELLVEPLCIRAGSLVLNDCPGLGVELRPAVIDRYVTDSAVISE